ncbi:MAG: leucine-rich repeat domain-containing protein [Deltaproteobacteria bacterium]|nr:leucine-rich repeat domain-containing protein [Deltaproteobacteria bacterium]
MPGQSIRDERARRREAACEIELSAQDLVDRLESRIELLGLGRARFRRGISSLTIHSAELGSLRGVGALRDLVAPNIAHNRVRVIPLEIGQLPRLQRARLDHNHIERLPDTISSLRSLRKLDLSHNNLETLPSSMGRLDSLEELDLSANPLRQLPASVAELRSLRRLRLPSTIEAGALGWVAQRPGLVVVRCAGFDELAYTELSHPERQ